MFAPRGRGYDSDSEDEQMQKHQPKPQELRRPQLDARPSLRAGPPGQDDKKKKKIKLPPQENIEKLWERFSKKQFSKALSVLPFEPVPASTSSTRANELLTAGYERAAEECRRRVRKIIQECKRVNMRYRDPGFDLDWDLKWEKGNTLNYLGKTKFLLSSSTAQDPTSNVPKAVKRVHEIFENPTFMKNINGSDVKQGGLGNCWFMASLSGLANVEGAIRKSCVEYNTRIGIYGFVFYRDGEWIYSIIDDKLFLKSPCWDNRSMQRDLLQQIDKDEAEAVYRKTYQTGSKALFFGQNIDQNETWVPLLEKAFAKAHGDYASLVGGWIGEGLEDLSGGFTTELLSSDILDTDAFWEDELNNANKEFLFGCSTGLLDGGTGNRNGIQERHAYNVVDTRTLKDGTRLVKLRNPWGAMKRGIWEGPYSDGSKEWNGNVQEELGHSFGSDSVFWITFDDMLRKFQHIDRTRLFRDGDWRCCQRWIGVDVPWRAQYHEKFHVRLARDSPLVLVLSQLDDRYFKGLQGQYIFDLHFRVHEQGRPEAEDYVVRSHGNYLMERSVGVEIPDMAAGNYSIWISIRAERSTVRSSVEAVVKRELKERVENDKLAQVGRAYDLAHGKAAQHLAEVARRRRANDHSKASEERKQERRKAWIRRHVQQDIHKAQQAKNLAKRERRKGERKAKAEKEMAEKAAAEKVAAEKAAAEKAAAEKAAAEKVAAEKAAAEKVAAEKAAAEKEASESKPSEKAAEKEDTAKESADKPTAGKETADTENSEKQPVEAPAVDKETPAEGKKESSEDGEAKVAAASDATTPDTAQENSEGSVEQPKPESETDSSEHKKDQAVQTVDSEQRKDPETKEKDGRPTHIDVPPHVDGEQPAKADPGSSCSSTASTPQDTPLDTPQSEKADAATPAADEGGDMEEKVPVPPVDGEIPGGPPPPAPVAQPALPVICQYHKEQQEETQRRIILAKQQKEEEEERQRQQQRQQQLEQQRQQQEQQQRPPSYSEDDSSDSPVSDWEELFSSDDDDQSKLHKRQLAAQAAASGQPAGLGLDDDETEDESRPEPWNAICIVGFRVYSKDEALELRVVMEGEALEEGGMGEKGEMDLDDAQANAGGEREKKKEAAADGEGNEAKEKKETDPADEKVGGDSKADPAKEDQKKQEVPKGDGETAADVKADGFASYPTIVTKGGEEYEKASVPVVNEEKQEATKEKSEAPKKDEGSN